jgi:hypothetical protein
VPVALFCNKIDLAAPPSLRPRLPLLLAAAESAGPADESLGASGADHSSGSGSESSVPRTRSQTPVESASESESESGDLQAMRALHRGEKSSSVSPPRGSEHYWFGGGSKPIRDVSAAKVDPGKSDETASKPGERGVAVKGCGKLRKRSSSQSLRESSLRETGAAGSGQRESLRASVGRRLSTWSPLLFTRSSLERRESASGPHAKTPRKSLLERQREDAQARAVIEGRDARLRLRRSIEEFPQARRLLYM